MMRNETPARDQDLYREISNEASVPSYAGTAVRQDIPRSPLGHAFEPVISIGPIGSRYDTLWFSPKCGGIVTTGCFTGTLAEFEAAVRTTHGKDSFGIIYRAAIDLLHTVMEEHGSRNDPPTPQAMNLAEVR